VAGTKNHGLTIEMGGQSIPLSATTVVAEQDGAWVIHTDDENAAG
jgi:hypothetical protein